ncbi:MAG: DUF6443 domain-containing protein, partial [bacterium]|nr:DUF6443 domain-containing protein [bacterium]
GSLTYQWQYSGDGVNFNDIVGEQGLTYDAGSLIANRWYRRKATDDCKVKYTNVIHVELKNLSAGSISTSNQSICNGTSPGTINASASSNNLGAMSYQWQSSSDGSNWSNISGATSEDYNPGTMTSTKHFRRLTTDNCKTVNTNTVAIIVYNLQAGSITGNQDVCYSTDASILGSSAAASGGSGSYTYTWYESNNNSTWVAIPSTNSASYDPTTNLTADKWYKRRVTDNTCGNYKETGSIHASVYNQFNAGDVGSSSMNNGDVLNYCYNENPGIIGNLQSPSGSGSFSYQWEYSTDRSAWFALSGQTSSTFDPTSSTTEQWYRRKATDNVCGNTGYSDEFYINFYDEVNEGALQSGSTVCIGENPPNIVGFAATGGDGVFSYQWEWANVGATNWNIISGANGVNYNPPVIPNSRKYRRKVIDNCAVDLYTNEVVVTVYDPLVPGTIVGTTTTTDDPFTIASSAPADGGSGSLVYSWEFSHDNQGWNPMPGTSASLYDSGFHTNVWIRRVVTDNGCSTTAYTPSVILQIGAKPTFEGFVTGGKVHRTSTNTTTLTLNGYLGTISEWQTSRYGYEWTAINNTTATLTVNNLDKTRYYRAKLEYQGYTGYSEVSEIHILSDEPGDVTPVNITDNKFTQSVVVKPITSMDDYLTLNDTTEVWKTISYTDGLGRAVMSYEHLVTPSATHQVGFQTYDTTGRSNRSYMPFVTNSVLNYENLVSSQTAYYQSGAITDPSNYAFAEVVYENSPAGIVLESGSVGEDWQLGNGHTVKSEIGFNRPGETVHKWTYDGTTLAKNGTYGTSMLSRIASTDENGNRVASYTDTHGKNVLKKVYLDNDSLETYYVYDDFERLVAIVPPEAVVEFTSSSQDFIDKWIFTYTYDSRGRLIEKKVPGTGPEYIVYSDLGEVVLTQDAQLRMNNHWAFAKADGRGRALYGGLYTNSSDSREALQEHLDSLDYGYETRTSDSLGYTNTIFPTSNITITSVSYYDDYDLDNDGVADESIDHSLGTLSKTDHQLTGMMTASKSRVIGTDDWLIAYYFYDIDGQSIQVKSQNHLVPDSMDVSSNFYLADGTLDYAIDKTHLPNGLTVKNKYRYDYDHRDRVTAIYHTINDGAEQELASYVYDDMGRLANKKLHKQGNDYLEQVDYAFTLQGRLKSINDPDQDGKAFAMEFFYNENLGGLSQTKQYNGNISAISWKSGTDVNAKAYAYSYDASDRLVGAKYGTGVAFAQNTGRYDVSNLAYDKNGNISSVRRKSWNDTITYDLDDLNMVYAGNQLKQVTDAGQAGGFTDGANTANEYDYNVAGSLTKDLNKGMDSILYNYLGQVDSIIFADSSALKYIYNGGGIKLAALEYRKDTLYQRKDYVGSMVLEDNVLKEYSIPEGRVVWNSNNDQERQYKLTDHQGNVRAVVSTLPKDVSFLATMDFTNESIEEPIFGDMDGYRMESAGLDTAGHVAGLNVNHPIGPRLMLNVTPGDTVNIKVKTYHEIVTESSQGFDPAILASIVSNSFSTLGGSENVGSVFTNAVEDAASALGLNGDNNSPEAQGYLNWVLLDNNLNLIAANTGFAQVSSASYTMDSLETGDLIMEKAGYLLVYVSNERQGLQRVYFDDLQVTLRTGNLEQVHEYYPFGQETAGSWQRPGSRTNAFSYNAGSEYSLATKWLETYYRPYDPALGRFTGIDVLADNFSSLTPYQYGFNDPVYWNDPVGDSPASDMSDILTAAYGFLSGGDDMGAFRWTSGSSTWEQIGFTQAARLTYEYNQFFNSWDNVDGGLMGFGQRVAENLDGEMFIDGNQMVVSFIQH